MREWSAEVVVGPELARRLIGEQFPGVELRSLRLLGEGWDNTVWLADERWAFRFPRRTIVVPGIERELDVLPLLAPRLPLPVPDPVFRGRPAEGYPWPFAGGQFLPGREVADAEPTDPTRLALARPLGAFLRALHAVRLDGDGLPVDPMGRADIAIRVPRTMERLAEVERLGLWRPPPSVGRLLEAAHELPPPAEPRTIAHGDLHFRHVLVGDDGAPTGVIDWIDVCRADPSIDLSVLWSLLPPPARAEALDVYGPVTEEQVLRARVLALFLCATLATYGRHEGMRGVEREAVAGLARTAAEG
jgi:aminoglycoside phosphotransferase (APT) family kinase protein